MIIIISVTVAITLTLLLYIILNIVTSKKEAIFRLKKYINIQDLEDKNKKPKKDIKAGLSIIGNTVSKLSVFDHYKIKVQKELIKAHIFLKGEEFITISIITTLFFALIFSIIFKNIVFGSLFGILGWLAPTFFIKHKKKKRISQLNGQLADAIVLISNSLKAGHSFIQAVEMVSKEMAPPIGEEFAQLQKEINLGYTTEQALENLANRVESDDLGLVIIAVLTQRQIGGNLAEILDNISGTIRDRLKIKGEIRTLTAQGRVSGAIICMVPIGLLLFLKITNPDYIDLLFDNVIGWCILGIATLMQLVGIYSISKIIKIEV